MIPYSKPFYCCCALEQSIIIIPRSLIQDLKPSDSCLLKSMLMSLLQGKLNPNNIWNFEHFDILKVWMYEMGLNTESGRENSVDNACLAEQSLKVEISEVSSIVIKTGAVTFRFQCVSSVVHLETDMHKQWKNKHTHTGHTQTSYP